MVQPSTKATIFKMPLKASWTWSRLVIYIPSIARKKHAHTELQGSFLSSLVLNKHHTQEEQLIGLQID
jgi:hypothetical protein